MRVGGLPIKLGASAPVRTTGSDGRVTAGVALAEIIGENPDRAALPIKEAMTQTLLITEPIIKGPLTRINGLVAFLPSCDPHFCMERMTRIELAWPAWKAGALPLSYIRVFLILFLVLS